MVNEIGGLCEYFFLSAIWYQKLARIILPERLLLMSEQILCFRLWLRDIHVLGNSIRLEQ